MPNLKEEILNVRLNGHPVCSASTKALRCAGGLLQDLVDLTDISNGLLQLKVPAECEKGATELLRFVSGCEVPVTEDNVADLAIAADYFRVDAILRKCRDVVLKAVKKGSVFRAEKLTRANSLRETRAIVVKYMAQNFDEVVADQAFYDLSAEALSEILSSDHLYIYPDLSMMMKLAGWLEVNRAANDVMQSVLVDHIPFQELKREDVLEYATLKRTSEPIRERLCSLIDLAESTLKSAQHEMRKSFFRRVSYLYVVGGSGFDWAEPAYRLDLSSREWSEIPHYLCCAAGNAVVACSSNEQKDPHLVYRFHNWSSARPSPDFRALDLSTGCEKKLAPVKDLFSSNGIAYCDSKVYIWGNLIDETLEEEDPARCSTVFCRYHPDKNEWETVPEPNVKRQFGVLVALKGFIYALGGDLEVESCEGIGGEEDVPDPTVVERYDPLHRQWARVAPMTRQRSDFCCEILNGKIYLLACCADMPNFEVYDPLMDEWKALAPYPDDNYSGSLTAVNGKLIAISGRFHSDRGEFATAEYDPSTNSWRSLPDIPHPRYDAITVATQEALQFFCFDPRIIMSY